MRELRTAVPAPGADAVYEGHGGIPQYGIDRDYPLLNEKAQQYDFAQRLGGCSDPLLAEIDAVLRELWMARRFVSEEHQRGGAS